ncbi:MAG: tRNA (cytidine(56)-2'-O)-methyltransferase [Candidatus Odinarchaeia archaeon]
MKIGVLRLGHRVSRDARISSHVFLTARAFGADFGILSGEYDGNLIKSIKDVVNRWGGNFEIRYEQDWKAVLRNWRGKIVHLTMYGIPIQTKIDEIRKCGEDLLIVVGSQKVPREIYEIASWNIAVTNQPHSEIASLCYFLDFYFERKELEREFPNAKIKVVPCEKGKKVIQLSEN